MEAITLKLQVYAMVKERILNGTYALGEKLNIDCLCREFSVSNSPVREALSLLAAEHLVVIQANTGAHVVSLTLTDYNELTDAYNILLLGAYEICCRRNKKALLLEQLSGRMERFERCVRLGDDRERITAIIHLDRCFITATENQKILALFDSDMSLLYLAYVYNHKNHSIDWQHNIRRSRTLIQAVLEDDTALVRNILCERTNPHVTD